MKKYISFGNYNKLYKHIWLYIITKYICDYVLGNILEKKANTFIYFPRDILIQQAFNYLISFIGSIFLFFYEKKQEKNLKKNLEKSASSKDRKTSYTLELIQNDLLEDKYLSISDYFIILFLFFYIFN